MTESAVTQDWMPTLKHVKCADSEKMRNRESNG